MTPPPPPGGYGQAPYGAPGGPQPIWSGPPLADYGQRVIAVLIDSAIVVVLDIAVFIVSRIFGVVSGALGFLVWFLGSLAILAYWFWNAGYLQGTTGQTLGKRQQGISLVSEATGQPVGTGMAVVRYIVGGFLAVITCSLYGIVDVLFPLWDPKRQRLTDKMFKFVVIKSQPGTLDVNSFNPFQK